MHDTTVRTIQYNKIDCKLDLFKSQFSTTWIDFIEFQHSTSIRKWVNTLIFKSKIEDFEMITGFENPSLLGGAT